MKKSVQAIKTFTSDVIGEVKKSSWPSRQELIESTIVVIVSIVLLGSFVGLSDTFFVKLLEWLFSSR